MSETYHYFSLQYSAIQKTALRHDRLWSIAGISQILSVMNELELPKITEDNGGDVLVAGGGKFTARFEEKGRAETARDEIIKIVSTMLPMLEFQYSEIAAAATLKEAKEKGLIDGLNEQKRRFRGYGVTFNPHLEVCEECGELLMDHGGDLRPACPECRRSPGGVRDSSVAGPGCWYWRRGSGDGPCNIDGWSA